MALAGPGTFNPWLCAAQSTLQDSSLVQLDLRLEHNEQMYVLQVSLGIEIIGAHRLGCRQEQPMMPKVCSASKSIVRYR